MKTNPNTNDFITLTENLLDENHTLSFDMNGFSMYPTLRPGEKGLVEKCKPEIVKKGDIVVFKVNQKLIAHRVVKITINNGKHIFTTKGDKNSFCDKAFEEEALVGKISSVQRNNKIVSINKSTMKLRKFAALNLSKIAIPIVDFYLRIKNMSGLMLSKIKSLKESILLISEKSRKYFFTNAFISVLQGVTPFVIIVCIKLLIDQLSTSTHFDTTQQLHFVILLIATALLFLLSGLLSEFGTYFSEKLGQSVIQQMYEKLQTKHATLDISNYENPDKQDKLHRAVQEASFRPLKMLNELLTFIKSIASSLFLLGLFISIRWYLMLILVVAIIPGILVRLKFSKERYNLKDSQSAKERQMYYFNRILTGFPFAKELKLFGFSDFFRIRFKNTQDQLFSEKIQLRKSELRFGVFAQLFAIILIFISLGFISFLKMQNQISIGTVVLFFFAFQRGYAVLNDFFQSITKILEDNTFLKDFIDFLNLTPRSKEVKETENIFSLEKQILFENVSFRYESSKRDALKAVNIRIPSGKTVAFVGANGSGKTTMIKLLCGFYEPYEGKIYFDSIDAGEIGETAICRNITAVFQDFALYNIPAIENLSLGNIEVPIDIEKAKSAAIDADIDDILSNLPNGYNTLLGNLFKSGEELSIGQWQKIAIARAFYRDSPLILMDEPSSALDANSEKQIINSLKKLAVGKTAVIVSHRLSTVQWADLIYFFDKGQVRESGNHAELMALKGKYFDLFQSVNNKQEG